MQTLGFLETISDAPRRNRCLLTDQKQLTLRYYFFRYGHPLFFKKLPHPLFSNGQKISKKFLKNKRPYFHTVKLNLCLDEPLEDSSSRQEKLSISTISPRRPSYTE